MNKEQFINEIDKLGDLIIAEVKYLKRNARVSQYPEIVLSEPVTHIKTFVVKLEELLKKVGFK